MAKDDLFQLPSAAVTRRLMQKYSPDQPRDDRGRWTAGGVARAVGGAALAGGAGLAGLAALGHPGSRAALNALRAGSGDSLRRAVLGARYREARQAARNAYNRSVRSPRDLQLGAYGASSAIGRERAATNAIRAIEGRGSDAYVRRRVALSRMNQPRAQMGLKPKPRFFV